MCKITIIDRLFYLDKDLYENSNWHTEVYQQTLFFSFLYYNHIAKVVWQLQSLLNIFIDPVLKYFEA
jgi:hypothetical protein